MQVNSLVICIDDKGFDICKPLIKNNIYTIRAIVHYPEGKGLLLEEVYNNISSFWGTELGYRIQRFKEIQPPTAVEISELLLETIENY